MMNATEHAEWMAESAERSARIDRILTEARTEWREVWADIEKRCASTSPQTAPALTEQAIVDALKADPAMAGRMMAKLACELMSPDRAEISRAAREHVTSNGVATTRGTSLQSLAVALAAASYRG